MNLEALKEAILRRRGKGLDLNIFLGGGPEQLGEESEPEELKDLAPDVKDGGLMESEGEEEMAEEGAAPVVEGEEHADAPQDKALIAKMLDEYGKSPMREKMKAMKK
jgi:hypothetical protein